MPHRDAHLHGGESGQTLNAKLAAALRKERVAPDTPEELEGLREALRTSIAHRIGLAIPVSRETPAVTVHDKRQWPIDSMAICAAYQDTTFLAMRAFDMVRAVDYLVSREDSATSDLAVVGEGLGGIWAMTAAAFDSRILQVACVGTIPSYRLITDTKYYACRNYFWVPGALIDFDLPDLLGLIGPRPAALVNPVDAMLEPLEPLRVKTFSGWADKVYARLGVSEHLNVVRTKQVEEGDYLADWLRQGAR